MIVTSMSDLCGALVRMFKECPNLLSESRGWGMVLVWGGREGISRPISMKYCCEGEGGSLVNHEWTRDFSESYFTLLKLKKHRKCTSVQKSEDYKTLLLILFGEITFVIGPDCIFVNLWGTCDSSVLQCSTDHPWLNFRLKLALTVVIGL